MKRVKRARLDGLISTEVREHDALWEMRLKVQSSVRALRGYGNDERAAAMHLIDQLRFYANWLALSHEPALLIGDEDVVRAAIVLRTGREERP